MLIEKEWLYFGFPFLQRLGHCQPHSSMSGSGSSTSSSGSSSSSSSNSSSNSSNSSSSSSSSSKKSSAEGDSQTAPTFLQFIDAVWQIWRQFPTAFEFNEELLLFLLQHMYSCLYGTFLANNESERVSPPSKRSMKMETVSVWTHIQQQLNSSSSSSNSYLNPFYKPNSHTAQTLKPALDLILWKAYYFRWNQYVNTFQRKVKQLISTATTTTTTTTTNSSSSSSSSGGDNKELNLENKRLMVLPHELKLLSPVLVSLQLSHNDFNVLPTDLIYLTRLKRLNLGNNQLTVVHPEHFGVFARATGEHLEELNLSGNQMGQVPKAIGKFRGLRGLDLSDNHFYKLPLTLSKLASLHRLNLSKNRLGQFPKVETLPHLQVMIPIVGIIYYHHHHQDYSLSDISLSIIPRGVVIYQYLWVTPLLHWNVFAISSTILLYISTLNC